MYGRALSHVAARETAPVPSASAGLTIGPRGVTSTSSTTSALPLIRIVSLRTSQGTRSSPTLTLRPSGPISSRNRSVLSMRPTVTPQAAKPLWPARKPGPPMKQAPATDHPGVLTLARYHRGGTTGGRCGSLATMTRPLAVFEGAIAQALEPPV